MTREQLVNALEREPHVDDAGFTERVMRALPPPRRRHPWRDALLAGATAAGWGSVAVTVAFIHPRAAPVALATVAGVILLAAWQTIANVVSD
jgi:hypothetical protein